MSDPFFASVSKRNGTKKPTRNNFKPNQSNDANKRKRLPNQISFNKSKPKSKSKDEEIESSSDEEEKDSQNSEEEEEEEEADETAEEKRLRLAKQYIQQLEAAEDELEVDAKEIDRDNIANRLHRDVLESTNQLYFNLSTEIPTDTDSYKINFKRPHHLTVNSVVIDPKQRFIFTASKDCSIVKLDYTTLEKLHTFKGGLKGVKNFKGHTDHILALAISSDGSLLASAGKDKIIHIWDVATNVLHGSLTQHKDSITGLTFRKGTYDLYSCSLDRSVKVWNAKELAYVETLFGHQDSITSIDSLFSEQCITSGSRDKTLRLWKILEQTQLVFRGGVTTTTDDGLKLVEGSLDKVAMIDQTWYITGGDSGTLSLWHSGKKKPVAMVAAAHGVEDTNQQPFGISALAVLPFTDLLLSGSSDGKLRLWSMEYGSKRKLTLLTEINTVGFINSISAFCNATNSISNTESSNKNNVLCLVLAVGQEHSYGRWKAIKEAKNGIVKIEIPLKNVPTTL